MAANMRLVGFYFLLTLIYTAWCQTGPAVTVPETTAAPSTTTTPTPSRPSTPIQPNTDVTVCTCDLTVNACDVNCCCDTDCTSDDRSAFTVCFDQYTAADYQTCVQSSVIIEHNTPYVVNTSAPGLFCVQYDNYESRNYYRIPLTVNTTDVFDQYKQAYGKTSFKTVAAQDNISTDFYKSGDPIYTIYDVGGGLLGKLGLPAPLISETCVDTNPASYLFSQTFPCMRPISDLSTECTSNPALSASSYYQGFQVVTTPEALNVSITVDNITTTESPVTTPGFSGSTSSPTNGLYNSSYLISIVPQPPHVCIDASGLVTECNFTAMPSPDYASGYCNNAVVGVLYTIQVNGTQGIVYVGVTFTFRSINDSAIPVTQVFRTLFLKEGQVVNETFSRSGNPGYQVNQPILAGYLAQSTLPDGTIREAIQLDENRDNWLTMTTSAANGECIEDPNARVSVTFGQNMRSGCFVSVFFSNMSDVCDLIQNATWNALRGPNPAKYLATFGNSSVQVVGDWVQILGIDDTIPAVQAQSPGICKNIVTGLHIELIYANLGNVDNPQAQIIGSQYQWVVQTELRYQCIGPYCQPGNEQARQRVEISSSVGFIDASQKPDMAWGAQPTATARLPEDFFYPFH